MAEGEPEIRKKNPHRFIVDDALNDDNSTVTFHPDVMEEMDFFRGGHVKIRGKRQKLTVAVSLPDDTCEVPKVRMNKVMRKNLKVHLGDVVIIHNCEDCKYGKRIHVLPFEDSIEGVSGNLFDTYLKPYFMEAYRPVRAGDCFIVRQAVANETGANFYIIKPPRGVLMYGPPGTG